MTVSIQGGTDTCQRMGDYLHTRPKPKAMSTDEHTSLSIQLKVRLAAKDLGQLVALGFDVTVFTPAPYQRHRL